MIDIDRFYELLNEVCEELPEDFFRELHHGVHLSEECRFSPYDVDGSMVVMGDYTRAHHGNKITIYYGSFARTCGWMSEDQLRDKLRQTVRHEFRHHMENLGGVHGVDSLEHEDREEIREMVNARRKKEQ
jgi:predicted Zn-dependent protease with MMP-like domain